MWSWGHNMALGYWQNESCPHAPKNSLPEASIAGICSDLIRYHHLHRLKGRGGAELSIFFALLLPFSPGNLPVFSGCTIHSCQETNPTAPVKPKAALLLMCAQWERGEGFSPKPVCDRFSRAGADLLLSTDILTGISPSVTAFSQQPAR